MERLTERIEDGQAISRMNLRKNGHQKCMNRLAEYEDLEEIFRSKMTDSICELLKDKEEFARWLDRKRWISKKCDEYARAEEQGKLLKLPCAVGDVVYTNASVQGWYFRKENRPYAAKVVFIGINGVDNYINVDFGNGHMMQFNFSCFGKKFFSPGKMLKHH